MASYLARYQQGEHEAVWRDLVALGARVREPAVRDDARAVAAETMRRVRHNLELLVPRLREIGFEFASPDDALRPPEPRTLAILDELERTVGPVPLSLRAFFEIVGSVCLMGSHPSLSTYTAPPDPADMIRRVRGALDGDAAAAPPPPAPDVDPLAALRDVPGAPGFLGALPANTLDMLRQMMQVNQQLMSRIAEIPREMDRIAETGAPSPRLAELHATAQRVAGSLGARMVGPDEPPPQLTGIVSDPLVVSPLTFDRPDDYRVLEEGDELEDDAAYEEVRHALSAGRTHAIDVAPDDCHKAGMSGGGPYCVLFPDAAADAPLVDSRYATFVEYLRESLRWGGFPGLADQGERPAELARLTAGLLPI